MRDMDTAERFSDRVEYYVKYRPNYPKAIIEFLEAEYGIEPSFEVADIGSGVGHSATLFTDYGCYVYGIEPNAEMYHTLIDRMKRVPNFSARMKTAANTDLDHSSVDMVVCGQAFHWFNERSAKTEFSRILKDDGLVILMWNSLPEDDPFCEAYTDIVANYSIGYEEVVQQSKTDKISYLYDSHEKTEFDNPHIYDLEGMKGRYMSSSYALLPEMSGYEDAMEALENVFDEFEVDGQIEFPYTCHVYHGRL